MNNFLKGGRGMLLFENQFPSNPLTIRTLSLTIIFCVLFSCLTVLPVSGQEAVGLNKIKPLQIGDTIPEELWDMPMEVINHSAGKDTIVLNDYRGKLIILDFWATWCGSCIGSINKYMNTSTFKDESITFVGVTYETSEQVMKFSARFSSKFQSIVQDSVLRAYFPHRLLPHVVVIKDNKLLFTAGHEVLYSENIEKIKAGQTIDKLVKIDVLDYDKTLEMKDQHNPQLKEAISFRSTILGPTLGIVGTSSYSKGKDYQKILITNKSLLMAMYDLLDGYWHNRIFLEFEKKDKFDIGAVKGSFSRTEWGANNGCGVEAFAPLDYPVESLKLNALLNLLNYYGYTMETENRDISCLVISRLHPSKKVNKNESVSLSKLLQNLNYQPFEVERTPVHLLDEDLSKDLAIEIDLRAINNRVYLEQALKDNGFSIRHELRNEPVIIVRERRGI